MLSVLNGFALTIEEGKMYTIANFTDGNVYVQDNGGDGPIAMGALNDNSYWTFEKAGTDNHFYVKNVATGRYAQACEDTSEQPVVMGDTPVEYVVVNDPAKGTDVFGMTSVNVANHDFTQGCFGWNWKAGNTVQTFAAVAGGNPRSFWTFKEYVAPTPDPDAWPLDGKTFTIENWSTNADAYMQDNLADDNRIECKATTDKGVAYWTFEKTGNEYCYHVKNMATGRYIQAYENTAEQMVTMGDTPAEFFVKPSEANNGAFGFAYTGNTPHDLTTAGTIGLNLRGETFENDCYVQTYASVAGVNGRSFWYLDETSYVGADPDVILTQKLYATGNLTIKYQGAATDGQTSVAVFADGASEPYATAAVSSANGTATLAIDKAGIYHAVLYNSTTHQESGTRRTFVVTDNCSDDKPLVMTTDKTEYTEGDPVTVTFSNAPALDKDWIGIYRIEDQTPSAPGVKSMSYDYVGAAAAGTVTLNVESAGHFNAPLTPGRYYVSYFLADGYTELFDRVEIEVVKAPVTEDETDMSSLIANNDFEDVTDMIVDGSNHRGIPFAWHAWGTRGTDEYTQEPGTVDTELLPQKSYGANGGSTGYHGSKCIWINATPMPDDFKLFQTVALPEAGKYRLTCLMSPMDAANESYTNLRLYAGDNAAYFGARERYGDNLGTETNVSFEGRTVEMAGSDPVLQKVTLEFTVDKPGNIEIGIRTSNMLADGTRSTGNHGRFRADYFCLTKINKEHVHNYVNGICTCDDDEKFETPEKDGDYYLLDNAGKVEWFSAQVAANGGSTMYYARLTADIDFENIENLHSPIGPSTGKKFKGEFDGQGHRIKNMIINRPEAKGQGFFGYLQGNSPCTVKNLIIDASCSITAQTWAGGIAGCCQNNGSTITLENLVNEADVTVSGQDAAGIIGGSTGDNPKFVIRNCINTGTITSTHTDPYVGALCCFLGNNDNLIENFINIGTINGHLGGNIGRMSGTRRNIADLSDTADKTQGLEAEAAGLTADDIAGGGLAYYINSNTTDNTDVFFQTLGEDAYPVPFDTSKEVERFSVGSTGYATYVADADVQFTGVEAYAVSDVIIAGQYSYVELGQLTEAPQGEPVIIKAAEGHYYYNPAETAEAPQANALKTSADDIVVDTADNYFVLDKPEGKDAGFYPVAVGETIPAGTAYLQVAAEGVGFISLTKVDIPDGIDTATVDQTDGNNEIYNLNGQRLQKLQRGINIVGGKKIVVK